VGSSMRTASVATAATATGSNRATVHAWHGDVDTLTVPLTLLAQFAHAANILTACASTRRHMMTFPSAENEEERRATLNSPREGASPKFDARLKR